MLDTEHGNRDESGKSVKFSTLQRDSGLEGITLLCGKMPFSIIDVNQTVISNENYAKSELTQDCKKKPDISENNHGCKDNGCNG